MVSSRSIWCGLTRYSVGLELQDWALQSVQRGESRALLLGLEHEPVVTFGRKSGTSDLVSPLEGFDVCRTTRGGQATLHEPGQLVIYPVAPVYQIAKGVKDFVHKSLDALACTVQEFGITAWVDLEDPGVFTSHGKIGFIGIQIVHGISQHGLSLNVRNPLQSFKSIRPCGHTEQLMDNFLLHDVDASPKDVFQIFIRHWFSQFDLTTRDIPANSVQPHVVAWRSW